MPVLPTDLEMIERLLLAGAIGAALGLEREWRLKTAGLRTNILIAVGSAVFTLMSISFAAGVPGADPGRVAAQIVTGIGFLGAGAIMRTDSGIHGLTTAATVWVNAALGVAVGAGIYHLALVGSGGDAGGAAAAPSDRGGARSPDPPAASAARRRRRY